MEDLSQAGRHRPQLRRADTGGQLDTEQLFTYLLPRQIEIDIVIENRRYLTETILGDRAQFGQTGESGDRLFEWVGNEPFEILRRPPGAAELTCTITGVVSGKASKGNCQRASRLRILPKPASESTTYR